MAKITVRGWYKDVAEVEAEELIVHFMDEEHFFLELRLKNGQTIQTMPIKGSV
jgi:hypothetical protein